MASSRFDVAMRRALKLAGAARPQRALSSLARSSAIAPAQRALNTLAQSPRIARSSSALLVAARRTYADSHGATASGLSREEIMGRIRDVLGSFDKVTADKARSLLHGLATNALAANGSRMSRFMLDLGWR